MTLRSDRPVRIFIREPLFQLLPASVSRTETGNLYKRMRERLENREDSASSSHTRATKGLVGLEKKNWF